MSGARRHHWIPESYLGLFSREGNTGSQVFVVDCVARKSFWTSTDNVCVKRDFNRIESPDLDRNALEKRLGQFESDAISALREIGAGRATTGGQEWLYGLNLMGLIATRNPTTRHQLTRSAERVTLELLQKSLESPGARWPGSISRCSDSQQAASSDLMSGASSARASLSCPWWSAVTCWRSSRILCGMTTTRANLRTATARTP
jgi:hypothetical protein